VDELVSLLAYDALPLISLNLANNELKGIGELYNILGTSLDSNTSLMELNLEKNFFTDQCVVNMIRSLRKGKESLCFLRLGGNKPDIMKNPKYRALDLLLEEGRRKRVAQFRSKRKPIGKQNQIISQNFNEQMKIFILQASPLVQPSKHGLRKAPDPLDFPAEKEIFKEVFSNSDVNLVFDIATTTRLQDCVTTKARVLHYSGHGSIEYLSFEDNRGGLHQLYASSIKKIISACKVQGQNNLKFVFVSACNSLQSGQAFVNAGVPHVICSKQDSALLAVAALQFTKQLYKSLVNGFTVNDSFKRAKDAILVTPEVGNKDRYFEIDKFLLLPEDGNHDVTIFDDAITSNFISDKTENDDIQTSHIPVAPDVFLGREVDQRGIIDAVLDNHRLINLVGPAGIGKSSIVAATCLYVFERKSFMMFENIIYIDCHSTLGQDPKQNPILCPLHKQMIDLGLVKAGEIAKDRIEDTLYPLLNRKKSLLVLDLGKHHDDVFCPEFWGRFCTKIKKVTVLIVSENPLTLDIDRVIKKQIVLKHLKFENSYKLLTNVIDIPQLVENQYQKLRLRAFISLQECPKKKIVPRTKAIYKFTGGGNPAGILAKASQMTRLGLKDLIKECIISQNEEERNYPLPRAVLNDVLKWIQVNKSLPLMSSVVLFAIFCEELGDREARQRLIKFFAEVTDEISKIEAIDERGILSVLGNGSPISICTLGLAKAKETLLDLIKAGLKVLTDSGRRALMDVYAHGEIERIKDGRNIINDEYAAMADL